MTKDYTTITSILCSLENGVRKVQDVKTDRVYFKNYLKYENLPGPVRSEQTLKEYDAYWEERKGGG